ncbi:MAG: DUF4254 domain-containing protein [Chlorobi bacterium]|nr:DUF4254 domain-containing protein [Chlorobiota bacterium]
MTDTKYFNEIFEKSINDYHIKDNINTEISNPYKENSLENLLYKKNWIDTVQWHLEDIIREPGISPEKALEIKRKIDKSNQDRTDLVELIDDWFFDELKDIKPDNDAFIATETPAWAIDRLSILNLKIYHMRQETKRTDADEEHLNKCSHKLKILLQQREDLTTAISQLFENIKKGKAVIKTYKQMKMYNDPKLNPVLRASAKK